MQRQAPRQVAEVIRLDARLAQAKTELQQAESGSDFAHLGSWPGLCECRF